MIGIVQNSVKNPAPFWNGQEDNITLEPVFEDVLGERARASVKELAEDYEE